MSDIDDKYKEIRNFLFELYKNNDLENDITFQYDKLVEIYGKGKFKHEYSRLLVILFEFEQGDKIDIERLGDKLKFLYSKIEENREYFKDKKYLEGNIRKLYDHISLEIQRINYMKTIDNKTEENKRELILSLNQKDEELKELIREYASEIKKIDEETMKKMGMYLSVFTLIAGNIAVLFKGIEVSPFELAGLIFIINSTLLISIRTLFYFVDKDKKVSRDVVATFLVGILTGSLFMIFNPRSHIRKTIEKDTKIYDTKLQEYDKRMENYEKEIYKLNIENQYMKKEIEEIEK